MNIRRFRQTLGIQPNISAVVEGILHLFTICKLKCKHYFANEVSSLQFFWYSWHGEAHMQLLAKGYLLIKDATGLDGQAYSDFISALVALRRI
jgi:hypothetical protein